MTSVLFEGLDSDTQTTIGEVVDLIRKFRTIVASETSEEAVCVANQAMVANLCNRQMKLEEIKACLGWMPLKLKGAKPKVTRRMIRGVTNDNPPRFQHMQEKTRTALQDTRWYTILFVAMMHVEEGSLHEPGRSQQYAEDDFLRCWPKVLSMATAIHKLQVLVIEAQNQKRRANAGKANIASRYKKRTNKEPSNKKVLTKKVATASVAQTDDWLKEMADAWHQQDSNPLDGSGSLAWHLYTLRVVLNHDPDMRRVANTALKQRVIQPLSCHLVTLMDLLAEHAMTSPNPFRTIEILVENLEGYADPEIDFWAIPELLRS